MKRCKLIALSLVLLLTACGSQQTVDYDPAQLLAQIRQAVSLPEMVDVADPFLEEELGLGEQDYESGVFCLVEEGLSPDEIVIVKAKTTESAARIVKKLEERLDYKENSARQYLTEFLPVIQKGVVRQDGLTVSLIVSDQVDQILEIYRQYK